MTKMNVTSAGVIVYRMNKNNKREYLIVRHQNGGHWDMPKGKLEAGETLQQAALRELAEETGITNITIDTDFEASCSFDIRNSDDNEVHKTVFFFLGQIADDKPIILSDEHTDYAWATIEQCFKQLTYLNAQQIIAAAEAHLQH